MRPPRTPSHPYPQRHPPPPPLAPAQHPQLATDDIATVPPPHTSPSRDPDQPTQPANRSPPQMPPSAYSPHTPESSHSATPYSRCPSEPLAAHPTPPAKPHESLPPPAPQTKPPAQTTDTAATPETSSHPPAPCTHSPRAPAETISISKVECPIVIIPPPPLLSLWPNRSKINPQNLHKIRPSKTTHQQTTLHHPIHHNQTQKSPHPNTHFPQNPPQKTPFHHKQKRAARPKPNRLF